MYSPEQLHEALFWQLASCCGSQHLVSAVSILFWPSATCFGSQHMVSHKASSGGPEGCQLVGTQTGADLESRTLFHCLRRDQLQSAAWCHTHVQGAVLVVATNGKEVVTSWPLGSCVEGRQVVGDVYRPYMNQIELT